MSTYSSPERQRSLSPWSKLRAAAIEPTGNESPSRARRTASPFSDKSPYRRKRTSRPSSSPIDSSASDSDAVVSRPVGRIAARLAKKSAVVSAHSSDNSRAATPKQNTMQRLQLKEAARSPSAQSTPDRSLSEGSDAEIVLDRSNSRFQDLVAKKRAERKAREDAQKAKEDARVQAANVEAEPSTTKPNKKRKQQIFGSDSEAEGGVRLTQQTRPTRKAGKKAIEEMHRETQRLARNQHLTHEARVKIKVTTNDLFKLFNFQQGHASSTPMSSTAPAAERPAATQSSDAEPAAQKDTPPTSPEPSLDVDESRSAYLVEKLQDDCVIVTNEDGNAILSSDEELSLQAVMRQARQHKGKEAASVIDQTGDASSPAQRSRKPPRKSIKIIPKSIKAQTVNLSDDDDLVVETTRPKIHTVFDQLPAQNERESNAFLRIRALAGIAAAPPKPKNNKRKETTMTLIEMHNKLQEQKRKQALLERDERLQDMKARGIEIRTAEEREKEQTEYDDLLEKAREEARELARKEKQSEGEDGEAAHHFGDSDEEDEDYVEGQEEADADADVELSGSEEENDENELIDDAASEGSEASEIDQDQDLPEVPISRSSKARSRNVVLDDDEEEQAENAATITPTVGSALDSSKVSPAQESPMEKFEAFGFQDPKTSPLALTQLFQATMDDPSQELQTPTNKTQSLQFLRGLNQSTLPNANGLPSPDLEDEIIPSTQIETSTSNTPQGLKITNLEAPARRSQSSTFRTPAKPSQYIEPTQDEGFVVPSTPIAATPALESTINTVIPQTATPGPRSRNRLRRRASMVADFSDEEIIPATDDMADVESFKLTTNAFESLFNGARESAKPAETYDKKTSRAKGMFAEQAEESEDEYAGLGGASDDESDHEFDEDLEDLIDRGKVDLKEDAVAQLHLEKERAADEKQIDKLYKDITTGGLRRKRGTDMDDLSDSEDEAAERRRKKQMDFARMRKALLEDEHLGKIAENPKKMAFLRAIEDRDDDADYVDFLGESLDQDESIPETQQEAVPGDAQTTDEQSTALNAFLDSQPSQSLAPAQEPIINPIVPSMAHRRTAAPLADPTNKRARTLAEIKESVSCLLEEPLVKDSQICLDSSDSESDNDKDSQQSIRSALAATRASVINRLRHSTSDMSQLNNNSNTNTQHMAFMAPALASQESFKIPSLLRRATTNMSTMSAGSDRRGSNTPTTNSGVENSGGVRRGGSKKSNIHYQAREAERKKIVDAADKKRRDDVKRTVKGLAKARKGSMLGMFGGMAGGGFD